MFWRAGMIGAGLLLILAQPAWSGEVTFEPVPQEERGEALEEMGTTPKTTAMEMFGRRKGYFHPFLSVGSYYTSNIFNTPDDEESDLVGVVSPGIWVAAPGIRQPLLEVETLNTAPGGLEVDRFDIDWQRRFQGYGLYRGDFNQHDRFSEAETEDHRLEGLLLYRAPGGLEVELLDIYEDDHDPFSTGDARVGELDEYTSNLFNPEVRFRISPKTLVGVNYSWYVLDYDDAEDEFRDREDHKFSGFVYYRFAPKTSIVLDYDYVAVDYDVDRQPDNYENRLFAGLKWKLSEKSRGMLKLGYGKKKYEGHVEDDRDELLTEVRLEHRFTAKTSMDLRASRKIDESDVQGIRDALAYRVRAKVVHDLTAKLSGRVKLDYVNVSYDGDITEGGETGEREDDKFGGEVALGFALKRWLNLSGGYAYRERDSTFDTRDYETHIVFVNVTAAL